jgi:hypothetical protein
LFAAERFSYHQSTEELIETRLTPFVETMDKGIKNKYLAANHIDRGYFSSPPAMTRRCQ